MHPRFSKCLARNEACNCVQTQSTSYLNPIWQRGASCRGAPKCRRQAPGVKQAHDGGLCAQLYRRCCKLGGDCLDQHAINDQALDHNDETISGGKTCVCRYGQRSPAGAIQARTRQRSACAHETTSGSPTMMLGRISGLGVAHVSHAVGQDRRPLSHRASEGRPLGKYVWPQ